ncbi:hypothetical protein V2J09_002485 [Rumex salicifolius]
MAATSIPSTSTSSPGSPFTFLSPRHRIPRQFRLRRRKSTSIRVRNQTSGDDFIAQFLSHLPPPLNSLNSLSVTALTFASGLAFSIPNLNFTPRNSQDWIFFSSPTPFNRFVLLRCPSISFNGTQFLENVNEKLVKEERHYVRLHSGRIPTQLNGRTSKTEASELQYSRVCVATDDGGVIALDWPSNLELNEESGLDSTVLLIPGTADGSSEQSVKNFVCHCLNRGLFPVVINPRGCADSPLTTPRLFTAADSDDVSSAIQFLSRARPWSTFMAVGWGFGANMLTKYLAEVGEKTPLTAAACIDNPFDLEEFTRSKGSDRKLTRGLINILKSNKGLFQGRSKVFDVESALSAKSVRDFDTAISMVSYGFETLEEFYSDSSSRLMVGDIKVPVLFIQSDNTSVPLFSIPREDIAENLFTSLLVCSLPSNIANGKSVTMWSQELTIEWLMAVELALLKGRHPLLMDVDVTIKPSKSLAIAESWISDSDEEVDEVLDLTESNGPNGYLLKPVKDRIQHEDDSEIQLANKGTDELQDGDYRQVNGVLPLPQSGSVDTELEKDESADAVEVEGDKGQVLQTAKVVMNVLDVTMPGTLTEERKKKVLDSIDQGETLVKALQDSVPEDVRGKLTTSVSAILETQGKNFNFDAIIGQINKKASEPKVKVNGNPQGKPDDGNLDTNTPSEAVSSSHDPSDSSSKTETSSADKSKGESDDNVPSQEKSVKSVDSNESKSNKSDELQNKQDGNESTMETHAPLPQSDDNGHEESTTSTDQLEKPPDLSKDKSGESDAKEKSEAGKVKDLDSSKDKKIESDDAKDNGEAGEVKPLESSKDQSKTDMPTNGSEGDSQSTQTSTDPQPLEKQDNETKNADEKSVPPLNLDQNKPSDDTNASTFNVTQAFDALTGLDDSTQVAVNSVFGAIEEVITRLEEKEEDGGTKKEEDGGTKKEEDGGTKKEEHESKGNNNVENTKDGNSQEEVKSSLDTLSVERKENHSGVRSSTSGISDEESDQKSDKLVGTKPVSGANLNNLYLMRANKTYAESVYNGYVQKFIQSNNLKKSDEHLDLDTTTELFLDYIPEEGQWKVLEQPESSTGAAGHKKDEFMETSYVILDSKKRNQPVNDLQKMERFSEDELSRRSSSRLDDLTRLVKNVVLDTLHVEVSRKLIGIDVEEMETALARDMEEVANSVALAVRKDAEHSWCLISDTECVLEQGNGFDGAHIVETISSAVHNTNCLRKMMPVGVIVGSSLASLRKFFSVASVRPENVQALNLVEDDMKNMKPKTRLVEKEVAKVPKFEEDEQPIQSIDTKIETVEKKEEKTSGNFDGVLSKDSVMVGAVTAALGASAFLQDHKDEDGARENSLEIMEYSDKSNAVKLEEEGNGKHQNMVISLAEKAMSVAAPVVPTKEDGEVDQDRVVAMLTELGQKGGMLRMVGKLALLWGGVRGAMSLTNKLIKVLRIAQRPLLQRILAFGSMVLILWSPVAVPFLPTIVQNWTTNSSSRFAELMCTFGLYAAIAFLMVIWGKRIRGYEKPLQQYGLDLKSSQNVQDLLIGLVGGVMLVISIHSVNALLGFVDLSWPSSLVSSPVDHTMKFKSWVNLVFLAGQGLVTATVIATVEELFFRSWLAEEIAVDLGDHRGIILSGLAFSLCQRSLQAIPGLWLLSLCLSGERRRKQGSLYSPIGLHAGIMASCFVLQRGGFLFHRSNLPLWMTGTHPFQPFSGIIGLLFSLVLALILYPRQQLSHGKEMQLSSPLKEEELL